MRNPHLALLALIPPIAWIDDARACSAPQCLRASALLPSGQVPANLGALLWTPEQPWSIDPARVATASVSLVASDGERSSVRLDAQVGYSRAWLVVPERPLREGIEYRLEQASFCEGAGAVPVLGPFTAGPPAPLPSSLGALVAETATVSRLEVSAGASCSRTILASSVQIGLMTSAEATPWRQALVLETIVDGQTWAPQRSLTRPNPVGESWIGRGVDRLFTPCPGVENGTDSQALAPGRHRVKMRARIPGEALVLETPEVEIELRCDTTGARDGGVVEHPDATALGGDTGTPDATTPGTDAGTLARDAASTLPTVDGEGASCASIRAPTHAPLVAVMLLGLCARRRRR